MLQQTVQDVQGKLPLLLKGIQSGEEVVIVQDGYPVARIVPIEPARKLGIWKGRVQVADDFEHLPEALTSFFVP